MPLIEQNKQVVALQANWGIGPSLCPKHLFIYNSVSQSLFQGTWTWVENRQFTVHESFSDISPTAITLLCTMVTDLSPTPSYTVCVQFYRKNTKRKGKLKVCKGRGGSVGMQAIALMGSLSLTGIGLRMRPAVLT